MRKTFQIVAALAGTVALTWALRPGDVERQLPEPSAAPVADAPGVLAVDLVDGSTEADLETIERLIGHDLTWTSPHSIDEALAQGVVDDLDDTVALLENHPLVEVVEPIIQMEAFGNPGPLAIPVDQLVSLEDELPADFPNDPMYGKQWHMKAMGAPAGWAQSPRGKGVIVAVIDTGVSKVEDLEGTEILPGATFVPGTKTAEDDQGHGTHVAGTIAQTTNNGKGVVGVAPEATIMPVKVLSKWGFGSSTWIAAGIDYAADNGADVINMSLGGPYSRIIHNAVKKARKKGVIVVAAVGNSGKKGVSYPGGLEESIGVSAVGPDGSLAFYSSWGKGTDIAAPGGDKRKAGGGVLQDTIDGKGGHKYAEFQGTSMATPHVAGAAAILLSSGAPAAQVEQMLLKSAKGEGGWDEKYGHGRLDLASALGVTGDSHNATRFALGMLFALLISQLAGAAGTFRASSVAIGGFVAGGLFFIDYIPGLPSWTIFQLLGTGVLNWPAILIGPDWMHFPLWLSAVIPGAIVFIFGTQRVSRPLALGVTCGVAAHLFHGAAVGGLEPWWMPTALATVWLGVNATACLVLGMAVAGAEKLDQEAR